MCFIACHLEKKKNLQFNSRNLNVQNFFGWKKIFSSTMHKFCERAGHGHTIYISCPSDRSQLLLLLLGKAGLGVLSCTVPGSMSDPPNTPEVRGCEFPFTPTSIHITVTLLQHSTERFSKALHSMKALTFENKTQTSSRFDAVS